MRKILTLTFCLFLAACVSATSVAYNSNAWDTLTNLSVSATTGESNQAVHDDTFVLKILTSSRSFCRYSTTKGESFNEMSSGAFEDNLETIHKKTFSGFTYSTVERYYVKCIDINYINNGTSYPEPKAELEMIVTIEPPISAQIVLDDSPLKAGKYEISLITTKTPASTPSLEYSYDGITYNPIILYGSKTSWKGFLVIPSSVGEEVGSFKFEAQDLEGRVGTEIETNSIFTVDTKSPSMVTSFDASGEYGQIKLEWFLDEDESDISEINIYRSESPGVDLTNLYKTIEETGDEYYYDTNVENGKTYYYRISFSDQAKNSADLSREVQATSLISKTSSTSTGLSSLLVGSVDAVLSEIELTSMSIESSDEMMSMLSSSEKEYANLLGVTGSLESATSELSSLKKTVEGYKTIDMTKELLDTKLNSARVKINVIRKKIPDSFEVTQSVEESQSQEEDSIRKAILQYSPELSPNEIDKVVKESLSVSEAKSLKIKSKLTSFKIIYLDGEEDERSVVEYTMDSNLEKDANSKFLLQLPSETLNLDSLDIKNLDYTQEQENMISFETDSKKITYIIDEQLDSQILGSSSLSLVKFPEESTSLTGNFILNIPFKGSLSVTLLMLVAFSLAGYLFFVKQQQRKEISAGFLEKAREVKRLQKEGNIKEAARLYDSLKVEYVSLSEKQKREVFNKIQEMSKK